VSQDIFSVN